MSRTDPGMTFEAFQQARWLSVYGATVALQVRERFAEGKGPPDEEAMTAFVEEAVAVANMAAAAVGDPER